MSDIFEEVDDDLRRDRWESLAKKYGGVVIGIAVLIVVGTAGYKGWQTWRSSTHQAATVGLMESLEAASARDGASIDALTAYAAKSQPGDMATLARLGAASALVRQGKADEAVAVYDAVAAGSAAPVYRELAGLLAVMMQIDTGDTRMLASRLEPLAAETSAWRYSAREMLAVLAIRDGDAQRAHSLFKQLADDAGAPGGVRARANDLAALYGQS